MDLFYLTKLASSFYGNSFSVYNSCECQCQSNNSTTGMKWIKDSWSDEVLFPLRFNLHISPLSHIVSSAFFFIESGQLMDAYV